MIVVGFALSCITSHHITSDRHKIFLKCRYRSAPPMNESRTIGRQGIFMRGIVEKEKKSQQNLRYSLTNYDLDSTTTMEIVQ